MMEKNLTKKQIEAVKRMKEALRYCKSAGILIFGMDNDLLYVTINAVQEKGYDSRECDYNPAADTYRDIQYEYGKDSRCGSFTDKIGGVYVDSGGW